MYQTVYSDARGDCLMACVASIVGAPLAAMPVAESYPRTAEGTYACLCDALLPRGIVPVYWRTDPPTWPHIAPRGYHIAVGKAGGSPVGSGALHAVVMLDGQIAHDPHIGKQGLDGDPLWWYLLIPKA